MPASEASIRALGEPGDLGWVVMAHGEIYAHEFGWNTDFEKLVLHIVGDYAHAAPGGNHGAWIAELEGERAGCIFCVPDADPTTAKLRILLVAPSARGRHLGRRLLATALNFAETRGYQRVRLWTNHPLAAARRLYLDAGFVLTGEEEHHSFGVQLIGQTYELDLRHAS